VWLAAAVSTLLLAIAVALLPHVRESCGAERRADVLNG
jgi:hypothetical protein